MNHICADCEKICDCGAELELFCDTCSDCTELRDAKEHDIYVPDVSFEIPEEFEEN